MSNTIPPLLCSTPPPIDDFGNAANENDDDFEPFESADVAYGQFDGPSEPPTPKHLINKNKKDLELPIPDFIPFSSNIDLENSKSTSDQLQNSNSTENDLNRELSEEKLTDLEKLPTTELDQTSKIKTTEHIPSIKDPIEFITSEPPPIDQTPKNSRNGSPLSIEFNASNLSDDDSIDFQINETKYDDNTSLPSLKFDAINISKSATPTSVEKLTFGKSPIFDEPASVENSSALEKVLSSSGGSDEIDQQINDIACENFENETNEIRDNVDSRAETPVAEAELVEKIDVEERLSKDLSSTDREESNSPAKLDSTLTPDDFNCDFQDFEGFSAFESPDSEQPPFTIGTEPEVAVQREDFTFEADFSQVQFAPIETGVSENAIETKREVTSSTEKSNDVNDDDFEDFQDFTSSAKELPTDGKDDADDKDDDDFGDFNDFQESIVVPVEQSRITNFTKIDEKLKTVLDMMFPGENVNDDKNSSEISSCDSKQLSNGELTNDLREIDTAKALEYQWSNSNMKCSLIRALGIDSRNILYGEKWNSSMPRFAANLGFSPLEPLKPTKLSTEQSSMGAASASCKPNEKESNDKPTTGNTFGAIDVPAVKFDWNSSGLVNPLDGVKEILHEGKTETIHSTKSNDSDPSDDIKSNDPNPAVVPSNITINDDDDDSTPECITSVSDVNNDLKSNIVHENPVVSTTIETYDRDISTHPPPTPVIPNTYMVPLKETHIYTPSKSENTIARSVKPDEKCPIDFDYEIAAAGIVINEQVVKKEYRDLVYNPEAQVSVMKSNENTIETDLDIAGPVLIDPNKNFRQKAAKPHLLSNTILNIMDSKADRPVMHGGFTDTAFDQGNLTQDLTMASNTTSAKLQSNPSKADSFDDEFSDFQSVPPSQMQKSSTVDPKLKNRLESPPATSSSEGMILSPAVLIPQSVKIESMEPKINWPTDSEINPDELARLEQLFPQAKQISQYSSPSRVRIEPSPTKSSDKDDDDWSDFVSVPPPIANVNSQKIVEPPQPLPAKINTISKAYDDDDWSDFVSSAPAAPQLKATNRNAAWNLAQMPPPQFASWNQPNAYNNSLPSTSQQSYTTSHQPFQQITSQTIVPTIPYQQYNNQFAVNGYLNQLNGLPPQQQQQPPPQQQKQQLHQNQFQQSPHLYQPTQQNHRNVNVLRSQLNTAPSISFIPELGFATPKTFVNIARPNPSKK